MKYLSFGLLSSASYYLFASLLNKLDSNEKKLGNNISKYNDLNFEYLVKTDHKKILIDDENYVNSLCVLFNNLPEENNNFDNVEIFELNDNDKIGDHVYQIISKQNNDTEYKFIILKEYDDIQNDHMTHTQNEILLPFIKVKKYYSYFNGKLIKERICLKFNK